MNIRNSAKAVIIENTSLLLTKNDDSEGIFYLFPGGGQNHGETLTATVIRECQEESGADVDVKELLHIREYIGKNHEHAAFDSTVHQIEYYFRCEAKSEQDDFMPPINPDSHQIGVEWLPVEKLDNYRIYPKAMIKPVQLLLEGKIETLYLGDVN